MLHYGRFMGGFLLIVSRVTTLEKQMMYSGGTDGLFGADE